MKNPPRIRYAFFCFGKLRIFLSCWNASKKSQTSEDKDEKSYGNDVVEEEVIDKLIASGDVTKSQRKEAVLELLEKADKSTEEFRAKVSKQARKVGSDVQKAIEKVTIVTRGDLDKLSKKFDKLQKVVERLEKKISSALK